MAAQRRDGIVVRGTLSREDWGKILDAAEGKGSLSKRLRNWLGLMCGDVSLDTAVKQIEESPGPANRVAEFKRMVDGIEEV